MLYEKLPQGRKCLRERNEEGAVGSHRYHLPQGDKTEEGKRAYHASIVQTLG